MSIGLPFEIREAIIQISGKAFWLKDPFRAFLISCGVPPSIFDRYADESKFKIARNVLSELDGMGEEGTLIQRRIVTELCKLRNIPDDSVTNKSAGLDALRKLKSLAIDQKLYVEASQSHVEARKRKAERKRKATAERAAQLEQLQARFMAMAMSTEDPQSRGYSLEDLIAELFELNEISYRRSYRTKTEQIDGHFKFKGFDYLVESRWRVVPPIETDLSALKTKADKKITSTRGLFVSIVGFREEVVSEFTRGVTSNIILMDGSDLTLILEGQVSLIDALDLKVRKAAQEGIIYFPLSHRF